MDPRLQAIAKLYLIFAHATDGQLTGDEMRMLAEKLRSWQPDATLDAVGEQIKATVEAYKQLGDQDARFAEAKRCAETLAQHLNPAQCEQVLADLGDLAAADGKIVPEETALIDVLATILVTTS
jgi:uncharacterized tellurite resistance protein B-like protein